MRTGFGQFCPVAIASEVLAERWTPILVRELLAGAEQFNEIHRGLPLISRALLARRLRELEAAGVISIEALPSGRGHRYRLTEAGAELRPVIEALAAWGQRRTARFERRNLDPGLLMWNLRRRVALERLPERRVVARFRFGGVPSTHRGPRTFWLVLERSEVDLCVVDPGFEIDLYVQADLATLARVWLGDLGFDAALRSRKIELEGPRDLVRSFTSWWLLSAFAGIPRPAGPAAGEARPRATG
jgi:DNA-binding HxlR family transcriptional regulator